MVTEVDRRVLEDNPALLKPNWLPPADDWPELAELRAEHERLLTARAEAWAAAQEVVGRHRAEDEARGEAMKVAVRENREPEEVVLTPPEQREAERSEALQRWEATTEALVEFLQTATSEIERRSPEFYAKLDEEASAADDLRQEAQRLLAEAEQVVAGVQRKRLWLDRGSGRSTLGHYPYEEMAIPPPPRSLDLNSLLAGGAITTVEHA